MQKALRKKIAKHASSKNHKDVTETITTLEKKVIESSILSSKTKSESLTAKCICTTYYVGYHNRSYTDHEHLIHFQEKNGVHLGCILHGRTTCTEMVNCISDNMRNLICQLLIKNGRKIALIADESTSVSNTNYIHESCDS